MNLRNWKRNSANAMYSASVRGRELFAFVILSSHDVFVAFYWATDFHRRNSPAKVQSISCMACRRRLDSWGIQEMTIQQPPLRTDCVQLWCTSAILQSPDWHLRAPTSYYRYSTLPFTR